MRITFNFRAGSAPLNIEVSGEEAEVLTSVRDALKDGTLLELEDTKGDRIILQGAEIAYVIVPSEQHRPVGFGR